MTLKLETMSENIVSVMIALSRNEMLGRLLLHNDSNPYNKNLPAPNPDELIKPDSTNARIFPYPFDTEATTEESSFIRVYYNDIDFDSSEVIAESGLHIDVIVAKKLWLINNGEKSLIRPYDIAGRVVDLIGRRSINSLIQLKFTGCQHLYINTKFDCIRLYAEYMSVES